MKVGDLYEWPPYRCTVVVDGEKRLAETPDVRLKWALTLYTMAGVLGEAVSPSLKKYIKENTFLIEPAGEHHGTEATGRL